MSKAQPLLRKKIFLVPSRRCSGSGQLVTRVGTRVVLVYKLFFWQTNASLGVWLFVIASYMLYTHMQNWPSQDPGKPGPKETRTQGNHDPQEPGLNFQMATAWDKVKKDLLL